MQSQTNFQILNRFMRTNFPDNQDPMPRGEWIAAIACFVLIPLAAALCVLLLVSP